MADRTARPSRPGRLESREAIELRALKQRQPELGDAVVAAREHQAAVREPHLSVRIAQLGVLDDAEPTLKLAEYPDRLARVDRALRLGASAEEAWSYLGEVEGGKRVIQAAVRSQHSGAAFAGSLYRVADDLRADRLIAADAAARRAGVLIVLPLGLCFLPAFVLAGLVPVIVAVLGDVLSP